MKNKNSIIVFAVLFLLAVLSRWVPHLWNFTLLGGVFLFAGAYFKDKKISALLMLSSMLVSDFLIGFHSQMLGVYFAYLTVVILGSFLTVKESRFKVLGFAFSGTLLFYVITNFAVWFEGQLYPMTLAGLVDCYVMGLPFYKNQLISDVVSSLLIFEVARRVLAEAEEKAKA